MKRTLALGLMLAIAHPLAMAGPQRPVTQGTTYLGAQYSRLTFSSDQLVTSATPSMVMVRGGAFLLNNIALEGRYGTGIESDKAMAKDSNVVQAEVSHFGSVYLTGHVPLGHRSSFYIFGGFSEFKARFERPGRQLNKTEFSGSYGAGYQINLSRKMGLNLEYNRFMEKSGHRLNGFTLGTQLYF
ncbi:porin family protein [Halomonadaceae bacterium KBTZ08]